MTTAFTARVPGTCSAGHCALPRLVAGGTADFADHTWGRQALLSRAADLPAPFTDLLDATDIDELVAQRGLRTPFVRVAKSGSTLPERQFTAGGGVGATVTDQVSDDKLVRLFADGATMVLQGLHRTWPPLIAFCQQLATELGHPVQANAYVTPPQNQGFDDHYDVHDVFVLQLAGEKRWRIHQPVHETPLRDQPWTDRRPAVERAAVTEPLLDVVLAPGDCLYLPRGFLHAATALGQLSAHLTLGVHTWTRHALADELARAALAVLAEDPQVRASLALGVDVADPAATSADVELVRARLLEALRDLDPAALSASLAARRRAAQRAEPVGPLAQLQAATDLAAGQSPPLAVRAHLAAQVVTTDDGAVLRSRAGDVRLGPDEVDAVRALLATTADQVDVGALGPDLTRRLVLAGVLVVRR